MMKRDEVVPRILRVPEDILKYLLQFILNKDLVQLDRALLGRDVIINKNWKKILRSRQSHFRLKEIHHSIDGFPVFSIFGIVSISLLKDGRIAISSRQNKIGIWNLITRKIDLTISGWWGQQFNDGLLAVIPETNEGGLQLWNLNTNSCQFVWEGRNRPIRCFIQLKDNRVAIGLENSGVIIIWNFIDNSECRLIGHRNTITQLVELPEGRLASSSEDCTIRIWKASRDQPIETNPIVLLGHKRSISQLILLSDGRLASRAELARDCSIRIWNITKRTCDLVIFSVHYSMAEISNHRLITMGFTPSIHIWDYNSGRSVGKLSGHSDVIWSIVKLPAPNAIHPRERLVTTSSDLTVRVWEGESLECEQVLRGHEDTVRCFCSLPDGRIISGSADGTIIIWGEDDEDPSDPLAKY